MAPSLVRCSTSGTMPLSKVSAKGRFLPPARARESIVGLGGVVAVVFCGEGATERAGWLPESNCNMETGGGDGDECSDSAARRKWSGTLEGGEEVMRGQLAWGGGSGSGSKCFCEEVDARLPD